MSDAERRFWWWHAGIPALAAVVLMMVFESTRIDQWITEWYYDPAVGGFPLRREWFFETVMHGWMKYALVVLALGILAALLASIWVGRFRPMRRKLIFFFLVLLLGSSAVSIGKAISFRHCPYDVEIYGGYAPHTGLFDPGVEGMERGGCFPGGHASGGLALMGFYFAYFRRRPHLARAWLIGGFLYGQLMGWGRIVQGAHFLSHNLWSAVVVWYVALALYLLILRPAESGRMGKGATAACPSDR